MGNIVIQGGIGQKQDHGSLFFLCRGKHHEGCAQMRPAFRIRHRFPDIADYAGLGQAFGQQLANLARAVRANKQNPQRMGQFFRIQVIEPAPAKAEQQRQGKKQAQCFTVETPMVKGV